MSSVQESVRMPAKRRAFKERLIAVVSSPRFAIYVVCSVLALTINYFLGKEMMWDTLDYHFYAGFSALHDRLNQDYFPAGPQTYLNPYLYVPFYLLASSRLPALAASSILAIIQSGILWLSYELAIVLSPSDSRRATVTLGACAVLLAAANPILLDQFGSSYADITTAELVLGGWLLLLKAVPARSGAVVACAGLLLGVVSALKLTNAAHAISAFFLLMLLTDTWQRRFRYALCFCAALTLGFAVVATPWALQLERHFGNPFFPLLNDIFRSPQYPTGSMLDFRFIPDSLWQALWRPFAIAEPVRMVDDEFPSPDLRYALLLIVGVAVLIRWLARRPGRAAAAADSTRGADSSARILVAIGIAFLIDWILWLRVSGNGRYFMAMACVAGVLAVALIFRLFAERPRFGQYLLFAVFGVQVVQLAIGTEFRDHVHWNGRPWFDVSVPAPLTNVPNLYFSVGEQSYAFVAPFVAAGSSIVNLGGSYQLGPQGASGERVNALIRKYSPHVRFLMHDPQVGTGPRTELPDLTYVNDATEPFGLRVDNSDCSRLALHDAGPRSLVINTATLPVKLSQAEIRIPVSDTAYLVSCRLVPDPAGQAALSAAISKVDVVFDRLEDECPELLHPRRVVTQDHYDSRHGQQWMRRYPDTGLAILIGGGYVELINGLRGGRPSYLGRAADWERSPQRLQCGRSGQKYFAKLSPPSG